MTAVAGGQLLAQLSERDAAAAARPRRHEPDAGPDVREGQRGAARARRAARSGIGRQPIGDHSCASRGVERIELVERPGLERSSSISRRSFRTSSSRRNVHGFGDPR